MVIYTSIRITVRTNSNICSNINTSISATISININMNASTNMKGVGEFFFRFQSFQEGMAPLRSS